jgi:beta-lactam-binding protein with PASTA domain
MISRRLLRISQEDRSVRLFSVLRTVPILLASCLLAAAPGLIAAQQRTTEEKANVGLVPDLVGQHVGAARGILNPRGLTVGRIQRVNNFGKAEGIVLQQKPAANERVAPGVAVDLIVASARTEVPRLTGLSVEAATSLIANHQLRPAKPRTVLSDAPEGTVVFQTPVAGESVQKGWIVSLEIAGPSNKPTSNVAMPDLRGRSLAVARQMLERSGLQMGKTSLKDAFDLPKDQVLEQSAAPQARVARGTSVDLTIASEWTVVPAIAGILEKDAVAALKSRQLAVSNQGTFEQASANPGSVLNVDPAPSARVRKGVAVAFQTAVAARPAEAAPPPVATPAVATPPALKTVIAPSLIGADSARAHQLALAADLRPVFQVRDQPNLTMNAVLDQEPNPGTRLQEGAVLTIIIASRFTMVPSLNGSRMYDARRWLEQADLVLQEARTAPDDALTERIAGQNPLPGTRVPRRSTVEVSRAATAQVVVPLSVPRGQKQVVAPVVAAPPPVRTAALLDGSTAAAPPTERADATVPKSTRPVPLPQPEVLPNSVVIPNLVGLTRRQASNLLEPLGVTLSVVAKMNGTDRPASTVLSQGPLPNQHAPKGSAVEVSVAAGLTTELLAFVGGVGLVLLVFGAFATIRYLRTGRAAPWPVREPIRTRDRKLDVVFYPAGWRGAQKNGRDVLELVAVPVDADRSKISDAILIEDVDDLDANRRGDEGRLN